MSDREINPNPSLVEPLTRRESEILVFLDEGFSAPEIAEQLTLAVSSVKWHIQQLYGKLGVNSKRQALNRARELGLLDATRSPAERKPAAAPPPVPQHNLPLQVTRFFGRETEISQLKTRLSEHRLVTLTGSGGVGKTRLSLRVAEEVMADFPDGVWFVVLAPLSDPALVPQQVAASLSLRDEPGTPIFETLVHFLLGRQVLLVLDNCEHMLVACAQLADALVRACPRVKLLASSREPLGVAGEAVVLVPSLPFPKPAESLTPEQLGGYASVSLFVDRAHLVVPDYQVGTHNAAALARICQRLDGIPLALEMAAGRLRLLNTEALAARLDDAFRLLTGGSRSALPRQQTLRAVIDWSYDLLSLDERRLLQRLSVFAGGCTLEAAEEVCSGEGLEAVQVLELLASLVEKSMVVADRRHDAETRYRLLEIVRQYASEKLREAGDSERLHTRHRDYFLRYVETNVPKLESVERPLWTQRLIAERENIRQALEWSFGDSSHVDIGPQLVHDLWDRQWATHQEFLGWHRRAVAWCECHAGVSPALYASVLGQASHAVALNDPQAALRWAQRAVDVCRGLDPADPENLMWRLVDLAFTYLRDLNEPEPARRIFNEAEGMLPAVATTQYSPETYQRVRASFAGMNSSLANGLGQYQAAKRYASESIKLREAGGDRWQNVRPLLEVGQACFYLEEFDQARDHFLAALSLIEEIGDGRKAYALRWLGAVDWQTGQLERALQYCQESLKEAEKIPDRNIIASCLGVCAGIAAKAGQAARAARLSGAAKALYAKQGRKPWEDSSLDTLCPGWAEWPDAAALTAAFETGQAMSADQAMAYALSDEAG
jgi:predicted ATPase/DNA-binding CsgD family transcriptional regulator